MKILLGYFGSDGTLFGKKLDSSHRKKYYVAMATIKNKISEHEDQNPFKRKQYGRHRVNVYSKTFCDKPRAVVYIEKYENGKKIAELRKVKSHYLEPVGREEASIRIMLEHISTNIEKYFKEYILIRDIYLPDIRHINIDRR